MRLIDADKFLKEILTAGIGKTIIEYSESNIGYMIRRQPTVYAAELLRDRWINVEDRLPELIPCYAGTAYSEAVVVLTSGKKAMIAIWDGVDFICAASYWDAEGEQITHWMPLPEPPEGYTLSLGKIDGLEDESDGI